jgi:hypothetical protein
MADNTVKIVVTVDDKASSTLGSIGSTLGSIGTTLSQMVVAGAAAATAGVAALAAGLYSCVDAAAEAQTVQAQLEAVLTSTGGVAGVTAQAANDLANSLSQVTRYEDDTILAGENMLLTFTNIGQNVFPQATETMLDMSAALGQDLQSSAIQLGKALNDPISGITALQRVGVTFTDEQKDMIESLLGTSDSMKELADSSQKAQEKLPYLQNDLEVATMKLAEMEAKGTASASSMENQRNRVEELQMQIGLANASIDAYTTAQASAASGTDNTDALMQAQTIILQELQKEFGGSAEAAGQTFAGQLDILKNNLGNVQEAIGTAMLPALTELAETFNATLQREDVQQALQDLATGFGEIAVELVEWLIPNLVVFVEQTLPALLSTGRTVFSWIVNTAIPTISDWGNKINTFLAPIITTLATQTLPALYGVAQTVFIWIRDNIAPIVIEWGTKLSEFLAPIIATFVTDILPDLYDAAKSVIDWIKANVLPVLTDWYDKFNTYLVPIINVIVTETLPALWQAAKDVFNWFNDNMLPIIDAVITAFRDYLTPILTTVWDKFNEFVTVVGPPLRDLWAALQNLWDTIVTLYNDRLKPAIDKLTEALGLNNEGTRSLFTTLGEIVGFILGVALDAIIIGIQIAIEALTIAIQIVTTAIDSAIWFIDAFSVGLEAIASVIQSVIDAVLWLAEALGEIALAAIPEWLIPGSPTQFELGLRGIAAAINEMPDLSAKLGGSFSTNVGIGGGNGGGGGTIMNVTFNGVAMQTQADANNAADMLIRAMAARGVVL